ncbi:12642_t:CDS:10 [Entrophospora sp. SA101]|nr:9713_t:CDS:10 [Entrophospora sp. SA101]CAJ0629145.1 12642_t:CDS:10 [Entrophospora sp. SA101]CAJ0831579.1 10928_t:CDS:10 [Entrophospora sp. SA101]CAJ0859608.1 10274_t:CDS:10 [Entrophospora sp. SA101]CAJ0916845.1 14233_t:CDS:10 [Entrophospora sp. SA101]
MSTKGEVSVVKPVEEIPQNPKPDKKKTKAKKKEEATTDFPLEIDPPPEYLQHRIKLFEEWKKEYDEEIKKKPRVPITITFPDGKTTQATAWETSPMDIAKGISKSLSERIVISKVDEVLFDLLRPLENDCKLEFLDFDHDEGKMVFWHSSAHVLGEACERHYGCHLCIGPPLDDGFYYEMAIDKRVVHQGDYKPLEKIANNIIKEKQPFERLVISKENLLEMFKHNQYKVHLIKSKIPDGTSTTVYRCGPLIDLCLGPHIPHTGKIKSFGVTKNSASYFLGDASNDSLQRIYGISFPDKKQMDEYKKFLEEADKQLFFFDDLSPGSCFFLPHGARIYNTLIDFIKSENQKRGYQEVITPNLYNTKLWEQSGHLQNYEENMFCFDIEKEKFALKPMNCPGHCLLFKHRDRSYRELPMRLADFGVLHRNELSGALSGLTRVRRFQQDDAHIFCREDQIEEEINSALEFLKHVYGIFGFTFQLRLSTRPEKYLGKVETWEFAEKKLETALNRFGDPWGINPGDGAFYGPKIDITVSDALKRKHQCATLQLDFQLPERFNLEYRTQTVDDAEHSYARPVMIHRAILGSVERMIAILTESFGGKWPFWLSPRQVMVIPVANSFSDYVKKVAGACFDAVVGTQEESTNSVNIRNRDDAGTKAKGETILLEEAVEKMVKLKMERRLKNSLI